MGYSLPAAVGAKIAEPDRRVVAVMGDGSFQMSLFELGTAAQNNVNLIIILFNNSGLGMVREIQNRIYEGNYGVALSCNPDFIKIAEAYGFAGKKVNSNEAFEKALKEAMKSNRTFVIECEVDPLESTF